MLTLQTREEVGKNTSKCRRWFTKVDAYWKIVTFQKVKTHTHCTRISWTSWKRRDNWSFLFVSKKDSPLRMCIDYRALKQDHCQKQVSPTTD